MRRSIWLVMRTAAGDERPFRLREKQTVIGRDVRCDIRIPLPKVGARHCELTREDGRLILRDLGTSPDGTLHRNRRVREAVLADGDQVTVGPVTFEVRFAEVGTPVGIEVGSARAADGARRTAPAYTADRGAQCRFRR